MDPYDNLNTARYQRQRSFPGGVSDGGAGSSSGAAAGDMSNDGGGDDTKKKKLLHRDIERQRRQEMAALFATLRNLLPLPYIKGKRAVSDHIHGAVNFIKDTQKRIKELSARRDEMKREMGRVDSDPNLAGPSHLDPACIIVQPCTSGVEVVISSAVAGPEALSLSRVLQTLQEQGLEVICSLTTRVNERLMHTIQVEVNSFACFDIAWLQQRLIEELIFSTGR